MKEKRTPVLTPRNFLNIYFSSDGERCMTRIPAKTNRYFDEGQNIQIKYFAEK